MKKMKALLSALLRACMCLSLLACTPDAQGGDQTQGDGTTAPTEQGTPAPEETTEQTTEEQTTDGEPEKPATTPVALYQLAPERDSLLQSYVIKTENGKLIVIDGGIDGAGKDRAPYMPTALRSVLGLGQDEYFEVEAWFLSHAHKDHMYELSKMLNEYSAESNYKINNIYFDFHEFGSEEYPAQNGDMEIYKIFDTDTILNRSPEVAISNTSGLAGIAYWVNKHLGLSGEDAVTKQSPIVVKIKEEIDRLYDDGRTTLMGNDELMQIIDFYYPRLKGTEI